MYILSSMKETAPRMMELIGLQNRIFPIIPRMVCKPINSIILGAISFILDRIYKHQYLYKFTEPILKIYSIAKVMILARKNKHFCFFQIDFSQNEKWIFIWNYIGVCSYCMTYKLVCITLHENLTVFRYGLLKIERKTLIFWICCKKKKDFE